ncbi:MAG TPA: hypothetical protein ENN85_04430 [Methanoculleus sp.]|nr:hypothetical protein [Methanoculleus sp.]
MMRIEGTICTRHGNAACVAEALGVDNLPGMRTRADGDRVISTFSGSRLRSMIASVDDYLMNLAIAEDVCCYVSH